MSMAYVQRYPFAPKAIWWKRYTNNAFVGKRVVYVATKELGYEIDGIPQVFKPRILTNGKLKTNVSIEYILITNNGEPTKAIRLLGQLYVYNNETKTMEQHDLVEDMEVLSASTGDSIQFEKNTYIRKLRFDCIKESDMRDTLHQPINGLLSNSSYLTLKTHNFSTFADKPQAGDILEYQGAFWMIEETYTTYIYTPKEKMVLFIALKLIKK